MNITKTFLGLILLCIIGLAVSLSPLIWGPKVFPTKTIAIGYVTSVTVKYEPLTPPRTFVHFQDGTTIGIWGEHNIPTGYREIETISSWSGLGELMSWK